MLLLIGLGVLMWLAGWNRTLVFYIAITITVVTLFVSLAFAGLFSYLFFPDVVRHWEFGEWWTQKYMWSGILDLNFGFALLAPLVFLADLLRCWFIVFNKWNNIFVTIATISCVYVWVHLWRVAGPIVFNITPKSATRELE